MSHIDLRSARLVLRRDATLGNVVWVIDGGRAYWLWTRYLTGKQWASVRRKAEDPDGLLIATRRQRAHTRASANTDNPTCNGLAV